MGPNGSGKSTLANAIMGHPGLDVTDGEIVFGGEEINDAAPEERSRAGLFLAFQYPVAIPGVTVAKYLRMALNAHREARGESQISLKDFRRQTEEAMELVNIPRDFSSRYINDGFSGGEKKRMEILRRRRRGDAHQRSARRPRPPWLGERRHQDHAVRHLTGRGRARSDVAAGLLPRRRLVRRGGCSGSWPRSRRGCRPRR